VNFRVIRLAPQLITLSVAVVLCGLDWWMNESDGLAFVRRFELATYDWRLRQISPTLAAPPACIVYVDEASHSTLIKLSGVSGWPPPRWLHSEVLHELTDQGVRSVGYDFFFLKLRPEDPVPDSIAANETVALPGTSVSDTSFAQAIRRHGKVVLGAPIDPSRSRNGLLMPAKLFASAASATGHARGHADEDGVLRRVSPFVDDPAHGRIWQLGLQTAALAMDLDLDRAEITPWEIIAPARNGGAHRIALDGKGKLMVPWRPVDASSQTWCQSIDSVLRAASRRDKGGEPGSFWKGRIAIIGSFGKIPPLADRGPSPLDTLTPYCMTHWHIANALQQGTGIHRPAPALRMAITLALMLLVSLLSWKLRAVWAALASLLVATGYLWLSVRVLDQHGLWLPLAMPLLGATTMTHLTMVFFRVVIEKGHKRRLRGIFQKLVSPRLLDMILDQPQISWAPRQKVLTVFFADIRGFTSLTDDSRLDRVGLSPEEAGDDPVRAHAIRDQHALQTVNLYLALVVDTIKKHGATLDKYMGDCVMAFWGAPLDDPQHASRAVRAAIEAQQLIDQLNQSRARENQRLEQENVRRLATGQPPLPVHALLTLGTGINTGMMTAGFMGSEAHLSNYTVFGREVNLAARLESLSGSGRILISQATLETIRQEDPMLASNIRFFGEHQVKGIQQPVAVYEVPWSQPEVFCNESRQTPLGASDQDAESPSNPQS
jgi:adenylate cyclase